MINKNKIILPDNIMRIEPVSYPEMLVLQKNAAKILTDSGGVQKEAFFLGRPCITLREETEWMETVTCGWNILTGTDNKKIVQAVRSFKPDTNCLHSFFGDGHAANRIVQLLTQ